MQTGKKKREVERNAHEDCDGGDVDGVKGERKVDAEDVPQCAVRAMLGGTRGWEGMRHACNTRHVPSRSRA
jgi:hypothetical protein